MQLFPPVTNYQAPSTNMSHLRTALKCEDYKINEGCSKPGTVDV